MDRLRTTETFFGRDCLKVTGRSFGASLWRANIPVEDLEEHSHESGHFVLALEPGYISDAITHETYAPPMTLVYSPPGTVHRDRCRKLGDRFLVIEVDNSVIADCVIDPLWVKDVDALDAAGKIAGAVASRNCIQDDDDLYGAVLTMLEKTCQRRTIEAFHPPWVDHALDALRDLSAHSDLRIAQIAHQVGVHPVQLSREFKRRFGISPSLMLKRFRVWRAAAFLSDGMALAEVALNCGFADQSHLTRSFGQVFGTTPGRFRRAFT